MADDEPKRDQVVRVNSGKLSNGAGAAQYSAVMAAEHRARDKSRVPPLTDFTADAGPPLSTENGDVSPDQLDSVEAAPMRRGVTLLLGKK
jgi:hypothetical protein